MLQYILDIFAIISCVEVRIERLNIYYQCITRQLNTKRVMKEAANLCRRILILVNFDAISSLDLLMRTALLCLGLNRL